VGISTFPTNDSVTIKHRAAFPEGFPPQPLLEIMGSNDIHARSVSLEQTADGIWVMWGSATEQRVFLPETDITLLRWFGPRRIYNGVTAPLWNTFDIFDSILVLMLSIVGFARRRRRAATENPEGERKMKACRQCRTMNAVVLPKGTLGKDVTCPCGLTVRVTVWDEDAPADPVSGTSPV
jgi:hypothetical protein